MTTLSVVAMRLPYGPGLGVTPDRAMLDKLALETTEIRA